MMLRKEFLTKEQMEHLTTKRLLAYQKKDNLRSPFNFNFYHRHWGHTKEDIAVFEAKYTKAYIDIKDVLAKREHVDA
jgi:hypothetical protein